MSRKDDILDAVIEIFREEGVSNGFTMSQLASKVEIGKSTLYEYFSTKEDIIKEAIIKVVAKSIEGIFGREIPQGKGFEEIYKAELRYLFNLGANSRFLTSLATPRSTSKLSDDAKNDIRNSMKQVGSFYEKRFQDIFQIGIEEGLIKVDNILINGTLISSLVIGSLMRMTNSQINDIKQIPMEDYINAVYEASIKIAN